MQQTFTDRVSDIESVAEGDAEFYEQSGRQAAAYLLMEF
jgi:hypothetical protein